MAVFLGQEKEHQPRPNVVGPCYSSQAEEDLCIYRLKDPILPRSYLGLWDQVVVFHRRPDKRAA